MAEVLGRREQIRTPVAPTLGIKLACLNPSRCQAFARVYQHHSWQIIAAFHSFNIHNPIGLDLRHKCCGLGDRHCRCNWVSSRHPRSPHTHALGIATATRGGRHRPSGSHHRPPPNWAIDRLSLLNLPPQKLACLPTLPHLVADAAHPAASQDLTNLDLNQSSERVGYG
jgi:hypothetical protein